MISDLINWRNGVLVTKDEYSEFAKIMEKDQPYRWMRGQKLSEHSEFKNAKENVLVHYLESPAIVFYGTITEAELNGDTFISFREFKEKLQEENK